MASYPTSAHSFPFKTDARNATPNTHATDHNEEDTEIVAVETDLVAARGSYPNISARLGGIDAAILAGGSVHYHAFVEADAPITIASTDTDVTLQSDLTGPINLTLPLAGSLPEGWPILVRDGFGGVTGPNVMLVGVSGSDHITNGTSSDTVYPLASAFAWTVFRGNGVDAWQAVGIPTDPDVGLGGVDATDAAIATQLAVKTYVDAVVDALPEVVSSDTSKVAFTTAGSPLETTMDVTALATETYVDTHTGSSVVPTDQFKQFRKSLARAKEVPFNFLALGDSMVELSNVGPGTLAKGWPRLFKDACAEYAGMRSPSDGYIPMRYAVGNGGWTITAPASGANTITSNGLGTRALKTSATATTTSERDVICDRFVFYYIKDPTYGAIHVWIDGVDTVTLDENGTSAVATWDSGDIGLGNHHLKFVTAHGANATFLTESQGFMPFVGNYDAGVRYWDGGHAGFPSWVPNTLESSQIDLLDPHLVSISYGVNDRTFTRTPTQTAQAYSDTMDLITFLAAGGGSPHDVTFVFLIEWGGDGEDATWPAYRDAIKAMGISKGAIVIDLFEDIGIQTGSTDLSDDNTHPNTEGCRAWVNRIAEVLLSEVRRTPDPSTADVTGDHVMTASERLVRITSLSGAATITLPPVASVPKGESRRVFDQHGDCNDSTQIVTVHVANGSSDTIAGAPFPNELFLLRAFADVELVPDGVNNWTYSLGQDPGLVVKNPTFTGVLTAPILKASGTTGAASPGRFCGITTGAAPSTGTFITGDYVLGIFGSVSAWYVCTAGGTPGTWSVPLDTSRAPVADPVFTGVATAPILAASGTTGAASPGRFCGVTTGAAPSTGTFVTGDWVLGIFGAVAAIYVCTSGGTPGTWSVPTDTLKANLASPTFTGVLTAPAVAASGLTGAANPLRLVGYLTTGAAPTTGSFLVGDVVISVFGGAVAALFVCTSAGTPGTWVNITLGFAPLASPALTGTPAIAAATGTSLAVTGALTSSGGKIGYATGAGGTVSQASSRTTTVVLSKLSGTITLFSTTLAADTDVSFTWTNTLLAATDVVVFNVVSGAAVKAGYSINCICGSGTATVTVHNVTPSTSASEAPVLQFVVLKGIAA